MLDAMPRPPKAKRDKSVPPHPLLQWRERYGVSQQGLSRESGVSQAMISQIENRQRIPLGDVLERLLAHTGLPTDAFIRPDRFMEEHPEFLAQTTPPPVQARSVGRSPKT